MTRDILLLIGDARDHKHEWTFCGGSNCSCEWIDEPSGERCCGQCSVPVHRCDVCGDYDYGDNDEANEKRRDCAEERPARDARSEAEGGE